MTVTPPKQTTTDSFESAAAAAAAHFLTALSASTPAASSPAPSIAAFFPATSLSSSSSTSSFLSSSSSVVSPLLSPSSSSSSVCVMGETSQAVPDSMLSESEAKEGRVEDSEEDEDSGDDGSGPVVKLEDGGKRHSSQPRHGGGKRHHPESAQSSVILSVPSSPIPSFISSSEPSLSPANLSPRDSLSSAGPPRRRRRKISDLGVSEVWECPLYLCHKRYKKTSIQSIALHKAKCGSRPQLQQLMSQQEEQLLKDRLLQQQSRQLHEQQLMLNRQQEEQQRQLMALDGARQALMMMQQQQQMQQQQMMQRPSPASAAFLNQSPFGLVPAAPFTVISPSNNQQLTAVGSSPQQLPLQQFSLSQTLSYPLSGTVEAASPSSSSLVSTLSPVTHSSVTPPMQNTQLVGLNVTGVPRPPSAQRPGGMDMLYSQHFAPSAFTQTSQMHQPQLSQQPQQPISHPWPVTFPLSNAGSFMSVPTINSSSVTVSGSQPMQAGSYGSFMPTLPFSSPLAVHLAGQQHMQQVPLLSTLQPSSGLTSPSRPTIHQPLALQQPLQQHAQHIQPHWLTGAQQPLSGSLPIHFVSTQATSMFVTSPSLSSTAASGTLPLSIGPSSRPPSQAPAAVSFTSPFAALSPDKRTAGTPPLVMSTVSSLSSLPSLQSPAAVSVAPSSSSAFVSTFSR